MGVATTPQNQCVTHHARIIPTMTLPIQGLFQCIRLSLLAASLAATVALADDYAPVIQLLRDGQLPEAMAKAEQYLAKSPRDPQMRFLKGLIQQDAGKQAEAIDTYTRLTQDYPELPEPYNNLAVLYAAQGQFDKTRDAFEMAKRASRSYAITYEKLGDVYAHMASQSYAHVLQLESGNTALEPKPVSIRQLIVSPAQTRNAPPTDKTRPRPPAATTAK